MKILNFSIIFCLIFIKFITAHSKGPQTCTSDDCHRQAKSLLSKIDTSVSPCDDFYQFACGNYKDIGSPITEQRNLISERLINIIRAEIKENDKKPAKLVKKFFQSCLQDDQFFNTQVQNVIDLKRQVDAGIHRKFSWWELAFRVVKAVVDYILEVAREYVDSHVLLVVSPQKLPKISQFTDMDSDQMSGGVIDYVVELGMDRNEAEKSWQLSFELDDELMKFGNKNANGQVEISTVGELQEIFKTINWTFYFSNHFNTDIDENFVIGIQNKEELKEIDKFLSTRSNDEIFNYVFWKFIENTYIKVHPEGIGPTRRSDVNLSHQANLCLDLTKGYLDVAVATIYVNNFFDDQTKIEILKMMEITKSTAHKEIMSNDFLDPKTKLKAIEKLMKLEYIAGYPDMLNDEEFLNDYYENLNFSDDSFKEMTKKASLNNNEKFLQIYGSQSVKEIRQQFIAQVYAHYVWEVNGFYEPAMNFFMLDAAHVNDFTYSNTRPMSLNFGQVGAIIGHEIIHGFDSNTRHYDGFGKKTNWWEKEADQEFINRSKCFIDQYDNYVEPVTGLNVNGTLTLGENIADNGGYVIAYKTYQNWLKVNKVDQVLPKVNFTSNQLFWISFGQSHCSNYDKNTMELFIKNDPHTPDVFRVNGVAENSMEFLNDFKCPSGSLMERKNKCKIW